MPDREKVIRALEQAKGEINPISASRKARLRDAVDDAIALLKEQEIVRCKDCIHYRYYGLTKETVSECTIDHCENPDKDWFCADGERR